MKLIQTISSLDKRSGGPSNSITALCQYLSKLNADSSIYTLDTGYEQVASQNNVRVFPIRFSSKLGLSPLLKKALIETLSEDDILHNHGLWMMPNLYPWAVKNKTKCKLMISPRGTLADWSLAQSKYKKRMISALGQHKVLLSADCFHATSETEYNDIRRYGLTQPVALIPNGVEIPSKGAILQTPRNIKKRLLYLGRVHAQKGIDKLLSIWPGIAEKNPQWELVICGPGDPSYLKKVKAKISQIGNSVKFQEAVYGDDKAQIFFSANLYILPTETENFGISVAEALAHKLPVIVSKGAPWGEIEAIQCGWWVDNNEPAYTKAISHAMSLSTTELKQKGRAGYQWMATEFGWEAIASNIYQTYLWLQEKASKPDCVRLD